MTTADTERGSRHEITRLVYAYAERIDAGDFEGVARLFEDGRLIAPDGSLLAAGYEQTLVFYRRTVRIYPETGTPMTQHVVTNLLIDIDEAAQRATASSCFTVLQKFGDSAIETIIGGTYSDRFACDNGAWHFRQRKSVPRIVGDLSQHLLRFA